MKTLALTALLANSVSATHDGTYSSYTHDSIGRPTTAGYMYGNRYNNYGYGYASYGYASYAYGYYGYTYPTVASCNSRQIFTANRAGCTTCPSYTRAQDSNTRCAANVCGAWQSVQSDGTCMNNAAYYPSYTGRSPYYIYNSYYATPYYVGNSQPYYGYTYQAACGARQVRAGNNMYCYDCPAYTRAQLSYTSCASDKCEGFESIIVSDGTCRKCSAGEVPDSEKRSCIAAPPVVVAAAPAEPAPVEPAPVEPAPVEPAPVEPAPAKPALKCLANQMQVGTYCQNCPAFSKGQVDSTYCAHDVCSVGQIQTYDGACATCRAGQQPDSALRTCIPNSVYYVNQPYCASNQIMDYYNGCVTCPAGTYADASRRNCYYQTGSRIYFVAVGEPMEETALKESSSNATAVFIALGAILVLLSAGTGAFIYKNKKLYFQQPEEAEQARTSEVQIDNRLSIDSAFAKNPAVEIEQIEVIADERNE